MTIAIKPVAISTWATIQIISSELLDQAQNWSDKKFGDKYREAILTLVAGQALLIGYLVGFVYHWLLLRLVKTFRYWLENTVQAVPVLYGWWKAPFVEIQATRYPESCWQALAPAVLAAIFNDELDWASAAAVPVAIS